MNVLAIETATPACAAGLATDDLETTVVVDDERHHTEALTPGIRALLARGGIAAGDLDRVVVDRGPGLFTGLRVGLATAIGLALATGAGLVGVTSLELLAHGARRAGVRGTLVAASTVAAGRSSCRPSTSRTRWWPSTSPRSPRPRRREPPGVVERLTVTGDGAARYLEVFEGVEHFAQTVPPALEALRLGRERPTSAEVAPLYLREADAVANFATRARRP